jgi:SAM-dependent methyltransferase
MLLRIRHALARLNAGYGVKGSILGFRPFQVWKFWGLIRRRESRLVRLRLGCGQVRLDGCMGTDICPCRNGAHVVRDLARGIPRADETVDFIFSEGFIEHLTLREGTRLLSDCYRVLKPGGVITIQTPDFRRLVLECLHRSQRALRWYKDRFDRPTFAETFNLGIRRWGSSFCTIRRLSRGSGWKSDSP